MQRILGEVAVHFRQLLTSPREELGRWQKTAAFWLRLAASCAAKLARDKAPQMAAALSFQTLFSLIPMLVLALLLVQSIAGLGGASAELRQSIIDFLLPESLISSNAAPVESDLPTSEEFNDARDLLRTRIDDLLLRLGEVNFAGVGAVGFLAFLYGATALMRTIEASFNSIYQAEETRPLGVRVPLYFTVLVLSPVLLVAAQIVSDRLLQSLVHILGKGVLLALIINLAPLAAAAVVLLLLFRLVPNTRVRWASAAAGAVPAAIIWNVFKGLFGLYLSRTLLTSLYGALALAPLFLLWIYGSWLIVLFGLELSYSHQFLTLGVTTFRQPLPGDPRWLLPIMARIAEGFRRGRPATARELMHCCQLSPVALRPYLACLEKKGLILRSRDQDRDRAYTLARPASNIPVREILALEPPTTDEGASAARLLERLRSRELEDIGDLTLDQLLDSSARRKG